MRKISAVALGMVLMLSFGCASANLGTKIGIMVIQTGSAYWLQNHCQYTGPGSTNSISTNSVINSTNNVTNSVTCK